MFAFSKHWIYACANKILKTSATLKTLNAFMNVMQDHVCWLGTLAVVKRDYAEEWTLWMVDPHLAHVTCSVESWELAAVMWC